MHTVTGFDLQRYLGEWHQVAAIPAWFQSDCATNTRANYALGDDGLMEVLNSCETADGSINQAEARARFLASDSHGKLEVTFVEVLGAWVWPAAGDYWIIGLDTDYQWSVVGEPSREFACPTDLGERSLRQLRASADDTGPARPPLRRSQITGRTDLLVQQSPGAKRPHDQCDPTSGQERISLCHSQPDRGEPKMNLRTSLKALVLIIPFALAACASQQEASSEKDIVDTAVEAGQFNTLVAAVQAADLVDTLKSDGPFTVFAPTDAAFAKLPDGTVENLLKPENKDQLVAVLTYHVVSGKIMSSDIAGKKAQVPTVQGSELAVDATSGVMVDNAMVVAADIEASNGVIHVIDTVVLPN
jgi:uncharacterized surface protein with fasciclin (FAS1) repeats/lipocalin